MKESQERGRPVQGERDLLSGCYDVTQWFSIATVITIIIMRCVIRGIPRTNYSNYAFNHVWQHLIVCTATLSHTQYTSRPSYHQHALFKSLQTQGNVLLGGLETF